jgi:hypothetical protein
MSVSCSAIIMSMSAGIQKLGRNGKAAKAPEKEVIAMTATIAMPHTVQ